MSKGSIERYSIKNKDGKEIFQLLDPINDKMICGCSNLLIEAKFCQICAKNVCKNCHQGKNRCAGCGEEIEDSIKLNVLIGKLNCKCIYCEEEIKIFEAKNHPQSQQEHFGECEGCSYKDRKPLVLLHQRECAKYLENSKLQSKKTNLFIDQLQNELEVLNDTVQEMKGDISNLNKKLKLSFEENESLRDELEKIKNLRLKESQEHEKRRKEKEYKLQEEKAICSFKLICGAGHPLNNEKAKNLCLESSMRGNKLAAGMRYFFGWQMKKNFAKSFQIFSEAVLVDKLFKREETTYCYFFVGYHHENGYGTKKDTFKAMEIYHKAAHQQNNTYAINKLAQIYQRETDSVQRDVKMSMQLYAKGVMLGDSCSIYNLANIYHKGDLDVEVDLYKAINLYKRAIELGNPAAMNNLAYLYNYGCGDFKQDVKKSIKYYLMAIDLKNSFAMNNLGYIYQTGHDGVQKNVLKAALLYQEAISLNNPYAMFNYASLLESGSEGIPKDKKKAMELFKRSSELGVMVSRCESYDPQQEIILVNNANNHTSNVKHPHHLPHQQHHSHKNHSHSNCHHSHSHESKN
eukprot:TRINITY_DN1581_c0_g2_i1.p1 TRINITY_DN1581_c0_g2~~TRINITY_DN1581_c0_g2_i1.p1  ORF type:complete len:574 (-),score=163.53 TRINITY_DN1581_c0_g2_i1:17-1738(-)